jgi:hypothetical protein
MYPLRLCLLRVLLGKTATATSFPFQAHLGRWHYTSFLRPACLFTVHMGSGSSPLSCGVFLPLPLLQAFPLLVGGRMPLLLPSPASLLWGIPITPPPLALRAPWPLSCVSFLLLLLIIQFFPFFPGWGLVCSGGYADLAQGCRGSTMCHLSHLLVCIFPSHVGTTVWRWHGSPPGFSV